MANTFISCNKYLDIVDIILIYHNEYWNRKNRSFYKYYTNNESKIINLTQYEENNITNINNDINNIHKKNDENIIIFIETSNKLIIDNTIVLLALKHINIPFKLIVRNYHNFTDSNYSNILQNSKCISIFSTSLNITINNEYKNKLIPIPLGIADLRFEHGKEKYYEYTNKVSKNKLIFFNFDIRTNILRKECYDKCINLGIEYIPKYRSISTYVNKFKYYKFVICPEGFGVDCHRLWEALYLQIVPICINNKCFEYWSKYFPIMIVDNWNNINTNPEYLNNYYEKIDWDLYNEKINFNYWKYLIKK
jgi:hypothetical protein